MVSKTKSKTTKYDLYNEMLSSTLVETQKQIDQLYDYEFLKGTGTKFYLNIETRQMVPIVVGKSIIRLTQNPNKEGSYVVYAQNQKILVPESDVVLIGFN